MAEVGSPVMAEMQPQRPATRLQDRLGKWARETLTPTGRAEVMAQRQIDSILAQVPEEKRAQAMEMLEARRPDLVASNLPGAKDRLVKEAVVGAATLGVLAVGGTVAYVKREAIMDAAFSMGIRKSQLSDEGQKKFVAKVAGMRKANFVASIRSATDPVKGFLGEMRNAIKLWPLNKLDINPREVPPSSNLIDALSGAIKIDVVDALNAAHPIAEFLKRFKDPMHKPFELPDPDANLFANELAYLAIESGKWVPIITKKGYELYEPIAHPENESKGMGYLIQKGLVVMRELTGGEQAFAPTEAFVEFVKQGITSSGINLDKLAS